MNALILFIYLFINSSVAKLYLSDNFSISFSNIETFKYEYLLFLLKKAIFVNFLLSSLKANNGKIIFFKNMIKNIYGKIIKLYCNDVSNYCDIEIIMKKYKNIDFYDDETYNIMKNMFCVYKLNVSEKTFYKLYKSEILSISLINSVDFIVNSNKYNLSVCYKNKLINIETIGDIINLNFFGETLQLNKNDLSENEKNIILTNFDSDIKKIEITGNIINNNYFNNAKMKIHSDNNEVITQFLENSEHYDFLLEVLFENNKDFGENYEEIFKYYDNLKRKIKNSKLVENLESLINCAVCDAYRKKNMAKKSLELGGNANILYNTNIYWKCIDVCDSEATFIGPLYSDTKEIKITDDTEEIVCDILDIVPKEGENYFLDFGKKYFRR